MNYRQNKSFSLLKEKKISLKVNLRNDINKQWPAFPCCLPCSLGQMADRPHVIRGLESMSSH